MISDWAFMNVQYLRFCSVVGYMPSMWSYFCVFIMQPHTVSESKSIYIVIKNINVYLK